jgi:hypothetical protein
MYSTAFQSLQQSSPMNGLSTMSSNTDMPHQSHSRPFTHAIRHIPLASNTSATAEHLIQTPKSLYDITAEWEGELYCYCGLNFAWDFALSPAIYSNTAVSFEPEPARQRQPNSCHRAFVLHSSACCLRLLPIYPYVYSSGRC